MDPFRGWAVAGLIGTVYLGQICLPVPKGSQNGQKSVLPLPICFAIMDINQRTSVRPLQADDGASLVDDDIQEGATSEASPKMS